MNRTEQDKEIAYVFKNKELIATQKRNTLKEADVILNRYTPNVLAGASKSFVSKAEDSPDVLVAKLVINTTNLIDSHQDCHIPGLWDKSIQETKLFYLLQEHNMDFDKIIADSVNDGLKASADTLNWSDLGYSYEGKTQALMFSANIKRERNPFMFGQYAKGYVLNHSVGMRYVKLFLCINRDDAEYAAEKDNWNKYYPQVANKEAADERGYFWAVTEAKMIEGSAVVKGSNEATPVYSITGKDNDGAASGTPSTTEPPTSTPKSSISDYLF